MEKLTLKEYTEKYGVEEVKNDYGETRRTKEGSIVFPNGWVASIVENTGTTIHTSDGKIQTVKESDKKYSVAMCDYNGYFDWSILDKYGASKGHFYCDNDAEIISACEVIRNL